MRHANRMKAQVAQVPLGTVNMTLRNSVVMGVCMGISRSYKIVQNKEKSNKSTYLSCCLDNLCFYGIWRGFRAISVGFLAINSPQRIRLPQDFANSNSNTCSNHCFSRPVGTRDKPPPPPPENFKIELIITPKVEFCY